MYDKLILKWYYLVYNQISVQFYRPLEQPHYRLQTSDNTIL